MHIYTDITGGLFFFSFAVRDNQPTVFGMFFSSAWQASKHQASIRHGTEPGFSTRENKQRLFLFFVFFFMGLFGQPELHFGCGLGIEINISLRHGRITPTVQGGAPVEYQASTKGGMEDSVLLTMQISTLQPRCNR